MSESSALVALKGFPNAACKNDSSSVAVSTMSSLEERSRCKSTREVAVGPLGASQDCPVAMQSSSALTIVDARSAKTAKSF